MSITKIVLSILSKKKGRYKNMTKKEVLEKLQARKARSAWQRGVKDYAIDLLDNIEGDEMPPLTEIKKALLNGTQDWHQYSWGGSALIYDCDICEALCSPSKIKRKREGELPPNNREAWLDTQARALAQACFIIKDIVRFGE